MTQIIDISRESNNNETESWDVETFTDFLSGRLLQIMRKVQQLWQMITIRTQLVIIFCLKIKGPVLSM